MRGKRMATPDLWRLERCTESNATSKTSFGSTARTGPKKCAKGRDVTLKGYGKESTNKRGKFSFELDGPAFPGRYKFKVAEEDGKGKTVCGKVKLTLKIN